MNSQVHEELQGDEQRVNDIRLKAREKAVRYFSLAKMIEETKIYMS